MELVVQERDPERRRSDLLRPWRYWERSRVARCRLYESARQNWDPADGIV